MNAGRFSRASRWRALAAGLVTLAGLGGCSVLPPKMEPIQKWADLPGDHVLVVGSVDLQPRADPAGNDKLPAGYKWSGIDNVDAAVLCMAYVPRGTVDNIRTDCDEYGITHFGNSFFLSAGAKTRYLFYVQAYMPDEVKFGPSFVLDIQPGDRAVYVGSIRYSRNEFFEVTKVGVADEYDKANAEFKKRFGPSAKLIKRLAIVPGKDRSSTAGNGKPALKASSK